ncbi:hypothetical protein V6N13_093304 [Hibiscus sabdariffa]|uniref:Uncharacterized protein n=2 Tax=Hibiscus sabdariffa TaxID=183260 RepID=A0ABR2BN84_9ROSI
MLTLWVISEGTHKHDALDKSSVVADGSRVIESANRIGEPATSQSVEPPKLLIYQHRPKTTSVIPAGQDVRPKTTLVTPVGQDSLFISGPLHKQDDQSNLSQAAKQFISCPQLSRSKSTKDNSQDSQSCGNDCIEDQSERGCSSSSYMYATPCNIQSQSHTQSLPHVQT